MGVYMIYLGIFDRIKKSKSADWPNLPQAEWPKSVIDLNEEMIRDFIHKYPLCVVDFWAPWCRPCQAMSARMRRLSKLYQGKVAFGKVNLQDNQNISKTYKIRSIPHFIFFHQGTQVTSITGVRSVGDLKKNIENMIKKYVIED